MPDDPSEGIFQIPLDRLYTWSPFRCRIWFGMETPLTREEITEAVLGGQFEPNPLPLHDFMSDPPSRERHIRRVAYLSTLGEFDHIQIDVGVPELGCHVDWMIEDGNHRLAAAFYRGDKTISASIMGSTKHAQEILGINIEGTS